MTNQEELLYLLDLTMQATLWRIKDSDEQRTPLELEVLSRIERLKKGDEPKTASADNVEEPLNEDDYKALEAARLNEHLASPNKVREAKERWKKGRCRVTIDGKPVWKLESDCHKEIIPGFEKKWHWVWNGSDGKKPQDEVNKLSDEFWEAHENGNDL